MPAWETLFLRIGSAVAQQAGRSWLRRKTDQANRELSLVQLSALGGLPVLAQRRLNRQFEQLAEDVADRVQRFSDAEADGIDDNERAAALVAVAVTLERAELDDEKLFSNDVVDVRALLRPLAEAAPDADLGEPARALYALVLKEAVSYLVEVVKTLPAFTNRALVEVLKRETQIIRELRTVLDRMPQLSATAEASEGDRRFEVDYRRVVADKFDQMQIFGASLGVTSRRYSLSVAYVTLTAVDHPAGSAVSHSITADAHGANVCAALAQHRRVLISGEAGSGKTTLLRWLAVRSAERSFDHEMSAWNDTVPFLVQLRNYAERPLPGLDDLVDGAGWAIRNQMPASWVDRVCANGRGLLLVDGVDELGEQHRARAHAWVEDLLRVYRRLRCVITSRPPSVDDNWMELPGVHLTHLQPMSPDNVRAFVRYWHKAVLLRVEDPDERRDLPEFERRLLAAIDASRALTSLATNPLLCALLCALNRDRRSSLPRDRMEIYRTALEMLLSRRDDERNVPSKADLTAEDKQAVLEDLAHWLTVNNFVAAPRNRVLDQVARSLRANHLDGDPETVYDSLLLRSGLLRERDAESVDFIHRTFQEYLAAKKFVDTDSLEALLAHAHLDTYSEVITLAVGHARKHERDRFLRELRTRAQEADEQHRLALKVLCVRCLETAKRLDPGLRQDLLACVADLVPPTSMDQARALALIGEDVLPLLLTPTKFDEIEATFTVHTAGLLSTRSAYPVLRHFAANHAGPHVTGALTAVWSYFNVDEYASEVLSHATFPNGRLQLHQLQLVPAVHHLKGVREVSCVLGTPPRPGELTALTTLPNLTSLSLPSPGAAALSELNALKTLKILHIEDESGDVRALRSLSGLQLEALFYRGKGGVEIGTNLDHMTGLRTLDLGSVAVDDLGQAMKRLPNLRSVSLVKPLGLYRLDQLLNTGDLTRLSISNCSLTSIGRCTAASSIIELTLSNLPNFRSLKGIEVFQSLSELTVMNTGLQDLGAIKNLPRLETLHLEAEVHCALDPLADLPSLRLLQLTGGEATVDLRPLAGKENLVVVVGRWHEVLGADGLGENSEVQVR